MNYVMRTRVISKFPLETAVRRWRFPVYDISEVRKVMFPFDQETSNKEISFYPESLIGNGKLLFSSIKETFYFIWLGMMIKLTMVMKFPLDLEILMNVEIIILLYPESLMGN